MEKSALRKELEKLSYDSGAALFGIADVRPIRKEFHFSGEILKDLDYAVSIGAGLSDVVVEDMEGVPTKIYYHHYRVVNMALDQIALRLLNFIQSKGYKALPVPASQMIDWAKQEGHLSHKKIGQMAGLGFIGRNNLLVNPELGSRFRLVTILTNAPVRPDKELKLDCGNCKACIKVCPVGAIKEKKEDFDRAACYKKLKEFKNKDVVGQLICGICIKACRGKR